MPCSVIYTFCIGCVIAPVAGLFGGRVYPSPPVSGSNQINNEDTGGGDIHRYSIPPLFRSSIVVCRMPQPQRPGHALERKESMSRKVQ